MVTELHKAFLRYNSSQSVANGNKMGKCSSISNVHLLLYLRLLQVSTLITYFYRFTQTNCLLKTAVLYWPYNYKKVILFQTLRLFCFAQKVIAICWQLLFLL